MKYSSSFSFSTKVWLTSLVVSPTLFILVEEGMGIFKDPSEGLVFVLLAILYGGFFSIPNWLLLTLGVTLAGRLCWSEPATRLLIQLWATVLTIGFSRLWVVNFLRLKAFRSCRCVIGRP